MFTGEEIRKKRKQLGLSVEELADLLKVNKDNLYKWEKGIKPSRPEDYLAIENWLNKILETVPRETGNRSSNGNKPSGNREEDIKDKLIRVLERENSDLRIRLNSDLNQIKENQVAIEAWIQTIAKYIALVVAKQEKKSVEQIHIEMGKNGASLFQNILKRDKPVRDGGG